MKTEKLIEKGLFVLACLLTIVALVAIFAGAIWHWLTFIIAAALAVAIWFSDKPFKK